MKKIQGSMEKGKMDIVMDPFTVKWVPDSEELKHAFNFGKEFAKKVK